MGYTIAEKILAAHCGRESVKAGEYITAKVDFVVGNDIPVSMTIKDFLNLGCKKVFNKDRILIVTDHSVPNATIEAAELNKYCREFANTYGITHYYDVGRLGISHNLVTEKGLVGPGDLVIGTDSHTCTYGPMGAFATGSGSTDLLYAMIFGEMWMKVPETIKVIFDGKLPKWISGKDLILYLIGQIGIAGANYKALEFSGEAIRELPMDGRFTISNMTIEAGAKTGLFEMDEKALKYCKEHCIRPYKVYQSDLDAVFEKTLYYDVSDMESQVALPHLPENVKPIGEVDKEKIKINQAFLGSCTNGRLEDIKVAAEILKGRKVAKNSRMVVIPGSQEIFQAALRKGYIETLIAAEAAFCTPTCGPCAGIHHGLLAAGEVCVSSSNRNFTGRMGSKDSFVYLASPAIVAASAVAGYITSPDSL